MAWRRAAVIVAAYWDRYQIPWSEKTPSHKHIEMLFVPFPQQHEQPEERNLDFRTVASEKA